MRLVRERRLLKKQGTNPVGIQLLKLIGNSTYGKWPRRH